MRVWSERLFNKEYKMNMDLIKKAGETILQPYQNCALALFDLQDYPTASTITVAKNDGINWITMCTGLCSNKVQRIKKNNKASLCFGSVEPLYNITLVGTIEILTDPDIKKEMWYEGLEMHFKGHDDQNYCVLKFTTKRYNLFVDMQEEAGEL